jgi:hypothetical protein
MWRGWMGIEPTKDTSILVIGPSTCTLTWVVKGSGVAIRPTGGPSRPLGAIFCCVCYGRWAIVIGSGRRGAVQRPPLRPGTILEPEVDFVRGGPGPGAAQQLAALTSSVEESCAGAEPSELA